MIHSDACLGSFFVCVSQNFGVGYSMAPADTSDMAAWTFLDQERVGHTEAPM